MSSWEFVYGDILINRGRLWRICAGAICFPEIYGDDIIFVTEDYPWTYSCNVGVRLTSDFEILSLGRGRRG